MVGTTIANYRILEDLGAGGMGVVYKAVDINLERTVAIKVLNPELSRDLSLIERFQAEAKVQASLNHTNIATLHNFLNVDGTWLIVMEYVDGETLEELIQRKGALAVKDALPIFKQALLGIGYAHRSGIIHRDVKPANIMLKRDGVVKVMDFGIAKALSGRRMTRTGIAVGTVPYMSPEQVRNRDVDIRSDIYSLGVTLYHMLTAHLPFESDSDFQVQYDHVNTAPPPLRLHYPYISPKIEAAVLKAMEKDPAKRFCTVEEFSAALDQSDLVSPAPQVARAGSGTQVEVATPWASSPGVSVDTAAAINAMRTTVPPTAVARAVPSEIGSKLPLLQTPRTNMIVAAAGLILAIGLGAGIWRWSHRQPPDNITAQSNPTQASNAQIPGPLQVRQGGSVGTEKGIGGIPSPTSPQTTQIPTTETNTSTEKVERPTQNSTKGTKRNDKRSIPPPAAAPGSDELAKAQDRYDEGQLLQPPGDCALWWAIKATQAGNPGGPNMEGQIQSKVHAQFHEELKEKAFDPAGTLISQIESFYQPGKFDAWRQELTTAKQIEEANKQTQQQPTGHGTPLQLSAVHTYNNVRHQKNSKKGWLCQITNGIDSANSNNYSNNCEDVHWYYYGSLSVSPDGSIRFHCNSADQNKACEKDIQIAPSDILNLRADKAVHIETKHGKYDFIADGPVMTQIRDDISHTTGK